MVGLKALFITMMIFVLGAGVLYLLWTLMLWWSYFILCLLLALCLFLVFYGVYTHLKDKREREHW